MTAKFCDICGTKMVRFTQDGKDVFLCPKEGAHGKIFAEMRRHRAKGRKGAPRDRGKFGKGKKEK